MSGKDVVEVLAVRKSRQRQTQRELLLALLIELFHDALTPRVRDLHRTHDVRQVSALKQELHDDSTLFGRSAGDARLYPRLVHAAIVKRRGVHAASTVSGVLFGGVSRQRFEDLVALLRIRHPRLELLEEDHVFAHVRREDEVGAHLAEPLAIVHGKVLDDTDVLVVKKLEE